MEKGSGQVEMTSSKIGTYDVSFPKRAADEAGGSTGPEELIAAAHTSCFAMQFSALAAKAGGTPKSVEVVAEVSLGPDQAGGFRLTGITLTFSGHVKGLDAAAFARGSPSRAKQSCPVSKVLTGVEINLNVTQG